jgi:hypothetical protein
MSTLGPAEGMAYLGAKLQAATAVTAFLANGANSIFRNVAPQAAINNPPYILVRYQGGADVMGAFADRLMTSGLYQVVVVGPDTLTNATLYPAAQALDAALHRTAGTALGGIVLACYREQPLMLSEVISGSDQQWTRIGGLYRLLVQ